MKFNCRCGGAYQPLPDEEATSTPPSFLARLFYCPTCDSTDWLEPYDLELEEWPEDFDPPGQ